MDIKRKLEDAIYGYHGLDLLANVHHIDGMTLIEPIFLGTIDEIFEYVNKEIGLSTPIPFIDSCERFGNWLRTGGYAIIMEKLHMQLLRVII